MWELADKYDHEDGHGVIGITKRRPQRIMRRPSEIYWNGLYTYNLINTGGIGVNAFLKRKSRQSNCCGCWQLRAQNHEDDRDSRRRGELWRL